MNASPPKNQDEIATEPAMGAITDRQLLVDMAQKLSALVVTVKDGFESGASRDLELAGRVTMLETRMGNAEGRLDKSSSGPSKHDLEAQASLAAEIAAREALAKEVADLKTETSAQTRLLERIEAAAVTWWSSPAGKAIRYVAWGAVAGWLAKNNIHIPGIN